MIKHTVSYFFFGIGALGLSFALARTYYLVWKQKKEREKGGVKPRSVPGDESHSSH
jgi:hypothetical protein